MGIRWVPGLILLCLCFLQSATSQEQVERCEDLSCEPKEKLLSEIRRLQEERKKYLHHYIEEVQPKHSQTLSAKQFLVSGGTPSIDAVNPNCSICNTNPCLNGGTCVASASTPFTKYSCICPEATQGTNCQKNITCDGACGANTDCSIRNHQVNCVCKNGFTGKDPANHGCSAKIVKSCFTGDPHYTTFDKLRFDYQGTCPYTFSQPCTTLATYAYYSVRAKNTLLNQNHQVSQVTEAEVTMYDNIVHVKNDGSFYFNGIKSHVPYYWPSKSLQKVTVTYNNNVFTIANDQYVFVQFCTCGWLCVNVPDIPDFQGNTTLCGLAGNIDNNYKDDVVNKNGTVVTIDKNPMPSADSATAFLRAQDSWITDDFAQPPNVACVTGEQTYNLSHCKDLNEFAKQCQPIQLAENKEGAFAKCSGMGNTSLESAYSNCLYDMCFGVKQCDVYQVFVRNCMFAIPDTDLGDWRKDIGCEMTCPPNSAYSSCMSSCPATCADTSSPDFCNEGCTEGCECIPGYVLDNTNLEKVTCIQVEKCGCTDPDGNSHPADTPWYSGNCSLWNTCRNGTYYSKYNECSKYGMCGIDSASNQHCVCKQGFTGDGYNCTDINECLNNSTCNVNLGHGTCKNTIGSYNCTCFDEYSGRNCEYYLPRRHCADLKYYWQYTASGVYTINPPYKFNGQPAFSNVSVYCDMDTDGGGWTLMSSDTSNMFADKSLSDYVAGFGTPSSKTVWLGLDIISGMTNEVNTSLRLELFRCAHGNLGNLSTYCTYPSFTVNDKTQQYTVVIPTGCSGSETQWYDGWARWDLSKTGPMFLAMDNDNSTASCSKTFQNTGFWYDTSYRCGSANLNGVRYLCNPIPDNSDADTYLFWNGDPLGQTWLWLRPQAYPNYDPHAITPTLPTFF